MRIILLLFLIALLTACTRYEPADFRIEGMAKDKVLEILGEPPHQTVLSGRQINGSMGPKPQLSASMADDESVEMWQYKVTDSRAAAVYFDDAGNVAEVIIFPTDVMY